MARFNFDRRWVGRILHPRLHRAMRKSLEFLVDQTKHGLRTPYPPASSPGEFPHRRTGALQQSIRVGVIDARRRAVTGQFGSDLDYATYLELGTSRMAPRPFLRPTIQRGKKYIMRFFEGIF